MKRNLTFLKILREFDPYIKFTYESNKENIVFLHIKVTLRNGKILTDAYVKPTDCHYYLHYSSAHPYHLKSQLFLARPCKLVGYAVQGRILKMVKRK